MTQDLLDLGPLERMGLQDHQDLLERQDQLALRDQPAQWDPLAWPDLKANSVALGQPVFQETLANKDRWDLLVQLVHPVTRVHQELQVHQEPQVLWAVQASPDN